MRLKVSFGRVLSSPTVTIVRCVALSITLFAAVPQARGDVKFEIVDAPNGIVFNTRLFGTITVQDAQTFETMVAFGKDARKDGQSVGITTRLESSGGDVGSAMKIGRAMRQLNALVAVDECYSACVLVLAGAPKRAVDNNSKVGIHRPYQIDAIPTTAEIEREKYQRTQREVQAYLAEMNIPTRLYEDMLIVPPERIRLLTAKEIAEYGLADDDPYVGEAEALAEARKYGITRQELARRKGLVNQSCWKSCDTAQDRNACLTSAVRCQNRILETGR